MRKQEDAAGQGISIGALCVGFASWLQRGEFAEHQLMWAGSQISWISWLCEMTSKTWQSRGKLGTQKLCAYCVLHRFQIFPILLDLKSTVNHPHGTAFWHGNHVPVSMLWKRKSTVAYLILHPHTLIFHSISWIICLAKAFLEQKFRDSWCSSVRLIL